MAANITLPGTGAVVETVDLSGVERQSVTISDRAGNSVDSIGGLTETAPASDTASSGLNGRLQRLAQRVTSLIALTPGPATTTTRILSAAASTNATSAKTSAGTLKRVIGYNAAATIRYLKIYNKASSPTVGTDTPILTLPLPPATGFDLGLEYSFATGIAFALTTGSADTDTGALTAGDILGLNVAYI